MNESSKEHLKELLQRNVTNELAAKCLSVLSNNVLKYIATEPVPLHSVRQIYEIRSSINNAQLVEGFDQLMMSLNAGSEDLVTVHLVEAPEEVFTIFTTSDAEQFIGILSSKGKKLKNNDSAGDAPHFK